LKEYLFQVVSISIIFSWLQWWLLAWQLSL
jgi:hypothetical protein